MPYSFCTEVGRFWVNKVLEESSNLVTVIKTFSIQFVLKGLGDGGNWVGQALTSTEDKTTQTI